MKTKKSLLIITIAFAFLLACQSATLPSTNNATSPAQTQEVVVQPTDEVIPTETQESSNLSTGEIVDDNSVSMVLVSEGEFTMGGNADAAITECQNYADDPTTCKRDSFLDEEPIHVVNLDTYYIDKYEVTNELYQKCVNSGVCTPPTNSSSETNSDYYGNPEFNNYPVIYVDWDMANAYCEWRGARLPTEAEWEKAARGTDERTYPWGSVFEGVGNFCDKNCPVDLGADRSYDDGYSDVAPVMSYPDGVSPYGIYNMAGNVWEWVADWYSDTYYQNSPSSNPKGPDTGESHVLRGGGFFNSGNGLRVSNRGVGGEVNETFGFRCAKDANP